MLKESFLIRPMQSSTDLLRIISRFSFPWSTPAKTQAIWETYHQEQEEGVRTIFVIEKQNEILGYGSLLRKSENPTFNRLNIPEVNAIWIDETCRRQGLGKALIQSIENFAFEEGYHKIGIGVGLYRDYGPAQRLYFRLGYIPDGSGITYKGLSTKPGQSYLLDDDLLLWLVKSLIPKKP
ncbi:MAG: GNAT family N-acetyltransferase [Chlamydiia bacterium]|nr:GNAT family N-acetyltransferase [Chlamydiia bacterium]